MPRATSVTSSESEDYSAYSSSTEFDASNYSGSSYQSSQESDSGDHSTSTNSPDNVDIEGGQLRGVKTKLAPQSLVHEMNMDHRTEYLKAGSRGLDHVTDRQAFEEVPVELMNKRFKSLVTPDVGWIEAFKTNSILLLKLNAFSIFYACFLVLILLYKQHAVFGDGLLHEQHEKPEVAVRGFSDIAVLSMLIAWSPWIQAALMFGFTNTKPLLKYWVPTVSILMIGSWAAIFLLEIGPGLDLDKMKTVPAFLITALSCFVVAHFMHKKYQVEWIRLRFMIGTMTVLIVAVVYFFILPPIWLSADSDQLRFVIRIVLHPLIFEVAGFSTRWVLRSMTGNHPGSSYILMVLLLTFSGIYGRFLVAAMTSTTWTLITAVVLSAEEIFLRLSVGTRDRWISRLFKGSESTAFRFDTIRAVRLRSDLLYMDIILENMSIIISGVTLFVFKNNITSQVGAQVDTETSRFVRDVAIQLALELVTDSIVLMLEAKRFNVPVVEAWRTRLNWLHGWRRHFAFVVPLGFLVAIAYSYMLSAYFDPRVGFLCEKCK
eukprot:TRINITY_DN18627_c0_g1_i1.p1 TRINITY_DN18627_c0_g1~~TRINITY_DN18627_c0_g1_i1.p1  ORF type:complete len:545 (+),score=125.09 TRINITY_DN18627_c0_g1_i1:136-1770(+)